MPARRRASIAARSGWKARLVITHAPAPDRRGALADAVRARPHLVAVLLVGVAVRMALIPITRGQDFVVWDKATAATLHGTNIYAHHPNYPGGPFAYFPLFLYVELPFQWLAQHTGVAFTILGKLPMLAGDVAVALLIARELTERGFRLRTSAIGAGLFFLNPLVVYNSAFYGRFDSLGCALLFVAVRQLSRERAAAGFSYALAVAMKTFPVFVLPAVLRAARGRRLRTLLVLAGVVLGLSAPYLGTWRPYLHDLLLYDVVKTPQYLSWQHLLLPVLDADTARTLGYVLLGVFALGALALGRWVRLELAVALTLVLFILLSKVVLDQYLTWPLPWVILTIWSRPARVGRASAVMVLVLTSVGFLANATIHPFGRSAGWLEAGLAACCAGYLVIALTAEHRGVEARVLPTGALAGPPGPRGVKSGATAPMP